MNSLGQDDPRSDGADGVGKAADAPSVPEERLVVFASPDSRLAVGDEALVRVTGDGVTLQRGASAGD